jgi:RNA polymerase-interacting CarD/CdnL/TRCF family regulator
MENNTNNNKKMINPAALANLTKASEVTESKDTNNVNDVVVRKKRKKTYKSFSLSLELENYNEFIDYLNKNEISSGSELIRDLMRDKGIIN